MRGERGEEGGGVRGGRRGGGEEGRKGEVNSTHNFIMAIVI